jgi:hypothetical protein
MVRFLVDAYVDKYQARLAPVIAKLCGEGSLRPVGEDWGMIRLRVGDVDFRAMIVKILETKGNGLKSSMKFLTDVFRPDEEFDIAECIRLLLATSWILDFLPSKKKRARDTLYEQIVDVYPFTRKVVEDFITEYLGLDPRSDPTLPTPPAPEVPSSDSDVESRGSLDDFVVDDSDDSEELTSNDETDTSSSSDDEPVRKKRNRSYSESSDSGSSSS